MADTEECKGCRATVRPPQREVDRIVADYLRTHIDQVVDEQTASDRLAACQSCPHLQYGTTCRFCGCLVAVRARLAGKSCPAPTPLWSSVQPAEAIQVNE